MGVSESEVGAAVRNALNARPDCRVWRNQVGTFRTFDGKRVVKVGLEGQPDYLGFRSVVVTPEMVGERVALFFACETKAPGGRLSKEQKVWRDLILTFGGIFVLQSTLEGIEKLTSQ